MVPPLYLLLAVLPAFASARRPKAALLPPVQWTISAENGLRCVGSPETVFPLLGWDDEDRPSDLARLGARGNNEQDAVVIESQASSSTVRLFAGSCAPLAVFTIPGYEVYQEPVVLDGGRGFLGFLAEAPPQDEEDWVVLVHWDRQGSERWRLGPFRLLGELITLSDQGEDRYLLSPLLELEGDEPRPVTITAPLKKTILAR